MKKAIIRDHSNHPDPPRTVAIVSSDDAGNVTSDPAEFLEGLEKDGIMGKGGALFRPSDGKPFIDALPFQFTGAYVRAEIIFDDQSNPSGRDHN